MVLACSQVRYSHIINVSALEGKFHVGELTLLTVVSNWQNLDLFGNLVDKQKL